MAEGTVKIGKKQYTLKFGMYCLRQLGKKWELDSVNKVIERFSVLSNMNTDDLSWEHLDIIADLVYTSATISNENESLPAYDEVYNEITKNPKMIEKVMNLFVESMPKAEKKPVPAKKK